MSAIMDTNTDADTASASSDPAPIFVDATGRRRRLIRRAAIGLLAIACAYGVAVVLSFLGGPVPPNALLPLPGVPNNAPNSPASPGQAITPTATGSAAQAGSGNAGTGAPGSAPVSGRAGAPSPSPSQSPPASPSPSSNRHVPPGHVGRSASPGPSNGHGH